MGRTDPVRVLNMPPKSDESSGNDDDGGDASSEDVTDPESDPLAVLALHQLTSTVRRIVLRRAARLQR